MTDIVEKLRRNNDALLACGHDYSDVLLDAANELISLRQQLETERMRLAACGVVALSNTPESATKARDMAPEYWSASCADVAGLVDSEMNLRQQLTASQAREAKLREALNRASGFEVYMAQANATVLREALDLPSDDSALKEYGKAERRAALLGAAEFFAEAEEYTVSGRFIAAAMTLARLAEELK